MKVSIVQKHLDALLPLKITEFPWKMTLALVTHRYYICNKIHGDRMMMMMMMICENCARS
jgi:hypothetical protein